MYLNFYGLNKEPFHITPDPEFLYLSSTHKEALAAIIYGIEQRKGFVAIIGEVGVGKTTILRSYLEGQLLRKTSERKVIYVFNANLSFGSLLRVICSELGVVPKTDDAFETVNEIHKALIEEYKQGKNVVLILDEAQNVPVETLENLRMLSNLETSRDKLIQMVLIGQPEFQAKLGLDKLRQLNQRIAIRSNIVPLSREDSKLYIRHRLALVTDKADGVFSRRAMDLIVAEAKGIPRVINILCDNALIAGLGYQAKPVGRRIVAEVVADYRGMRKSQFRRWGLSLTALLVLLAGALFLSPIRGFVLRIPSFQGLGGSRINVINPTAPKPDLPTRMPEVAVVTIPQEPRAGGTELSKEAPIAAPSLSIENPETGNEGSSRQTVLSQMETKLQDTTEQVVSQPAESPSIPVDREVSTVVTDGNKTPRTTGAPTYIVKKGETLSSIIRDTYGTITPSLFELVRQNNPQITDADRILAGGKLLLPHIDQLPERPHAAVSGAVR